MQRNHDFYRILNKKAAKFIQIRTNPAGTVRKEAQTLAGILKSSLFAVQVS